MLSKNAAPAVNTRRAYAIRALTAEIRLATSPQVVRTDADADATDALRAVA